MINANQLAEVVLVNEADESLGSMEKMAAHQKGLLHRAFSVFIFNDKGEMLLQQRSAKKYHSPALWSNACCSHPAPGQDVLVAAKTRLQEEMGFTTTLQKAFSFIYRTEFDNGLTEHEYDHVFYGTHNADISPNADEVMDYCFMSMDAIEDAMLSHPQKYTSWFHIAFPKLKAHLALV